MDPIAFDHEDFYGDHQHDDQRQLWWRCWHGTANLIEESLNRWTQPRGHFFSKADGTSALHALVHAFDTLPPSLQTTVVGQLVGIGVDINARDHNGCTALHYVSSQWKHPRKQAPNVFLLAQALKNGADPFIADGNGRTAIAIIVAGCEHKSQVKSVLRVLEQYGHLSEFFQRTNMQDPSLSRWMDYLEKRALYAQQQRIAQEVGTLGQDRRRTIKI